MKKMVTEMSTRRERCSGMESRQARRDLGPWMGETGRAVSPWGMLGGWGDSGKGGEKWLPTWVRGLTGRW